MIDDDEIPFGEGESVTERAENGGEQQVEMFVVGEQKTMGNLYPKGLPKELKAVMTNHDIAVREGLFDPNKTYRFAVTCQPGETKETPVRELQPDGSTKIVSTKVTQKMKPVFLESMGWGEEAMQRSFRQLLAIDGQRAGKCLDGLTEEFSEWMRSGERAA